MFFSLIGSVAGYLSPLTIKPGQFATTFELAGISGFHGWNLVCSVDSKLQRFHALEPETVLDVKFVPQWASFEDSVRLIFSLTNEGTLPRTVRLALLSVRAGDGLSAAPFADGEVNGACIRVHGQTAPVFAVASDFSAVWVGPASTQSANQWNHTFGESAEGDSVSLSWQGITLRPGQTVRRVMHFALNRPHLRKQALAKTDVGWPIDVFLKASGVIRPLSELSVTRRAALSAADFDLLLKPSVELKRATVGVLIHFERACAITSFRGAVAIDDEISFVTFHLPGVAAIWAGPLDRDPGTAFCGNRTDFEYSGQNATLAFSWGELDLHPGSAVHLAFSAEESPVEDSSDGDTPAWKVAVVILGFIFPNLIATVLCLCCRGMTAPFFTLFSSLALNVGYASLVLVYGLGDEGLTLAIPICFGLWGLTFLTGGCACEDSGAWVVCKQLRMEVPKTDAVVWAIRNDRQLAPYVTVTGTASHQESREVATEYESYKVPIYRTLVHERRHPNGHVETWTQEVFWYWETRWRAIAEYCSEWGRVTEGGGHFHRIPGDPDNRIETETVCRTVELWRQTDEYVYSSWQENAPPVQFPSASLLRITVKSETILDEHAQAQVAEMRRRLAEEGARHDTTVETHFDVTVPNFTASIIGTVKDRELAEIQRKYGGGCGFTIWTLCLVTGYQAIFESVTRLTSAKLTVQCSKSVSGGPLLRATHRQPDGAAAENAIQIAETRSEPLLSNMPSSYTEIQS